MLVLVGYVLVLGAVFGGYSLAGGHMGAMYQPLELLMIGGAALGALIIMSPKKVLVDIVKGLGNCLKGAPHNRASYEDLLKVLYELFLLGRRNGIMTGCVD